MKYQENMAGPLIQWRLFIMKIMSMVAAMGIGVLALGFISIVVLVVSKR